MLGSAMGPDEGHTIRAGAARSSAMAKIVVEQCLPWADFGIPSCIVGLYLKLGSPALYTSL